MLQPIEFFFDFLSPFCYLANTQIAALAERHGRTVDYKVFDMPRAKRTAGNTGPSNRDIPVKIKYLVGDLDRWAKRYDVPISFPKNLNSEKMNIGTFYAIARGQTRAYVDAAYDAGWGRGGALDDEAVLGGLAGAMGWPRDDFLAYLVSDDGKAAYEAKNEEAAARGVFGAPVMFVGDEIWWGNDRLEFLDGFLAGTIPAVAAGA